MVGEVFVKCDGVGKVKWLASVLFPSFPFQLLRFKFFLLFTAPRRPKRSLF